MQQRIIPKTGQSLPTLGYGCMRFPTRGGRIDVALAKAQVRYAIDHGVTYLDTAWPYHMGASESFLGDHVLTDGYRDKVKIATKLPCYIIKKASQFESIFESQRKKLRVDVIDYYMLHALNGATFREMVNLGILDFLNQLKAQGKVGNVGFSFHDRYEEFGPICDAYDWDFCQVQFNLIDEDFQAGIRGIRHAASRGMGVFVMEPLRGGTLVSRMPHQVQVLYDTAPVKRAPADWALRWILDHEEVTMVLSGMNDYRHIDENIAAADSALPNALTTQEHTLLGQVRQAFDWLLTVKCTACQYCMPCPAGIDIPGAFKSLNDTNMFGKTAPRFFHVRSVAVQTADGKPHWTNTCLNCGKCEAACPQHLPIREKFKLVQAKLENPPMRLLGFALNTFTKFGGKS